MQSSVFLPGAEAVPLPGCEATVPADVTAGTSVSSSKSTCASCAARVEKRLNRVPGVRASVNLALETAHVAYPAELDPAELVATIERTGYTSALPALPANAYRLDRYTRPGRSVSASVAFSW